MNKECRIAIKVLPKASRSEIIGWENDELKVRLRAVPEKGEANRTLIEFLAKVFQLPKSSFELLRGETSRHKFVQIQGLEREEVLKLIENYINQSKN